MNWVKVRTSLRHNRLFKRMSDRAQKVFFISLLLTGENDAKGALVTRLGPFTPDELADELLVKPKQLEPVLQELISHGFLRKDEVGIYHVERFEEKTESPSAARMRVKRGRDRDGDSDASHRKRHSDASHLDHSDSAKEEEGDIPNPSGLGSVAPSGAGRRTRLPKATTEDAPWVQTLREGASSLADRQLQSLSADERHLLARYHCLVFANCTKSEANNKAKATQVAAAFASMSRSRGYNDLTVREYVKAAHRVHEMREKTPWFDPWQIKSVVEFEAA